MAPVNQKYDFDFIVIGGGSGGSGAARRAAQHGAKVAVIEGNHKMGGTCVCVGCVPKKIMWHAEDVYAKIKAAKEYGFDFQAPPGISQWKHLKEKRDAYIKKLNGIYLNNFNREGVESFFGHASFVNEHELEIEMHKESGHAGEKKRITGERICLTVGGRPTIPKGIPGSELGITSDGFFELEELPKKVVVVGAGYIAIELAGIMRSLGAEVHLCIRHDKFLRAFDPIIQDSVMELYEESKGVKVHRKTNVKKVSTSSQGPHDLTKSIPLSIETDNAGTIEADCLLWAIGRSPETDHINMPKSVELDDKGHVKVDKYQESSVKHITAVGDVTGQVELTPVAIAAGRRLSDRLFGGEKFKDSHLSYDNIPSVLFTHPTAGAIGLTEPQAKEKYGEKNIKVYTSTFVPLYYSMLEKKEKSRYKLICQGPEEKVVGLHIYGDGSDEILQGFGVAIKMGATKKDFDECVAIHPTSAEELVTLR